MNEKKSNPEELMQKLNDNQLNDDELEMINGGGLYVAVNPNLCPKHRSKYVIYWDRSFYNDECTGCEHAKELGRTVHCEFAISGNYEWE
jgi:hypothetical protein